MYIDEFNKIVEGQCVQIKNTLIKKQDEYNFTLDRLDSFKRAADLEELTPVRVLEGYLTKHIISIYDMLNSNNKYPKTKWDEKIGDSICYLILLKALLADTDMYSDNDIHEY